MSTNEIVKNRYDFIYLFDVTDGNPNGDPNAGNTPRIDIETGQGLVTDVCLKRKVRNYVQYATEDSEKLKSKTHDIFVKENAVLNDTINNTIKEIIDNNKDEISKSSKNSREKKALIAEMTRKTMCARYYDIRTFGAVLSTGDNKGSNSGQVRGAVQMTFSRSIDPIFYTDHSITRMAATASKEEKDNKKEEDGKDKDADGGGNRTMGRKATVPYGLYLCHGFVTPAFAERTGFSEEDLELFWEALGGMFDLDRSASRGLMGPRGLYIFKHSSKLGNARAQDLFDRLRVEKTTDLPRSFRDYKVTIKDEDLPEGVELIKKI